MHTENSINDINSIRLDDIVNFIMVKIKNIHRILKTNGQLKENVIESISASLFDVITQVKMNYCRHDIKMVVQILTELIF